MEEDTTNLLVVGVKGHHQPHGDWNYDGRARRALMATLFVRPASLRATSTLMIMSAITFPGDRCMNAPLAGHAPRYTVRLFLRGRLIGLQGKEVSKRTT